MTVYLQHIDWRVVLLALLGYYLLPSLLTNVVLASLTDEATVPPHLGRPAASFCAFFYLFLPPLAAGHFAARFARRLPLMTSAVLAVAGCLLTAFSLSVSILVFTFYTALCLALALTGGYQAVKRQRCD